MHKELFFVLFRCVVHLGCMSLSWDARWGRIMTMDIGCIFLSLSVTVRCDAEEDTHQSNDRRTSLDVCRVGVNNICSSYVYKMGGFHTWPSTSVAIVLIRDSVTHDVLVFIRNENDILGRARGN
jgi:hypothetical protein